MSEDHIVQTSNGSHHLLSPLHELRVHHAKLEAQNQELIDAQTQLAESRDRFEKLYNFAPIGYANLTSRGKIHDINITGAVMLDYPRSRLINMPFALYVDPRDKAIFKNHLRHCNSGRAKVVSEMRVTTKNGKVLYIQL